MNFDFTIWHCINNIKESEEADWKEKSFFFFFFNVNFAVIFSNFAFLPNSNKKLKTNQGVTIEVVSGIQNHLSKK